MIGDGDMREMGVTDAAGRRWHHPPYGPWVMCGPLPFLHEPEPRRFGWVTKGWLGRAVAAAVDAVIARREDERKRERIERVRKQKEAAA